ncbi:MAG TPA: hypothetical protein VN873_20415 [Candidatus Angelobacter sp.]|nr:hypothetical protein [Candidatus Angelobacter sp.]
MNYWRDSVSNGSNLNGNFGCRTAGALLLLLVSFIVGSCSSTPKDPPGTIHLDHGEVFTRERLVNERLNNVNWLNNALLNTPAGGTLQGARFRSVSTSISGQVSAEINPLGGVSPMDQVGAQTAHYQNAAQREAWKQLYQGLESNTISYTALLGTNGLPAAPAGSSSNGLSNVSPVINVNNFPTGPTNPPPGPSNALGLPSSIELTSVEKFQDQLAYRDAVLGEIHEQQLDDTHDQAGMTLYTLNFHLSVEPGLHNKRFGRVSASFCKGPDGATPKQQYQDWMYSFRKTFDEAAISLQRRYLQNALSDEDIRQLIVKIWASEDAATQWTNAPTNHFDLFGTTYTDRTNSLRNLKLMTKSKELLGTNLDGATVKRDKSMRFLSPELTTTSADMLTAMPQQLLSNWFSNNLTLISKLNSNHMVRIITNELSPAWVTGFTNDTEFINSVEWREMEISNKFAAIFKDTYEYQTNKYHALTNEIADLSPFMSDPDLIYNKRHTAADLDNDKKVMKALCWVVRDQFDKINHFSGPLVKIKAPDAVSLTNNQDFMYLMKVDDVLRGDDDFASAMQNLEDKTKNRTFVYAIEPKEYAQNLMDESDAQSSRNLSLGLAAAIPQISTSLSAFLNYLQQDQYMLETIKRRPLLTSYMDGDRQFGWLIGGRFKIADKKHGFKLSYEQIPLQEAVQVTLEVPSWWTSVKVDASSQWLKPNADPFSGGQIRDPDIIELKPDYASVTRALMERAEPDYNQPQIYPAWNSHQYGYVVQAGTPANLLILGRNLWRNPKVFIGLVGAQDVESYSVLPDMQGIVASFSQINLPPTLSTNADQPVTENLRVVTSDGEAVLKDGVTIVSTGGPAQGSGFIVLTNSFGVASNNLTFTATPGAPSVYYLLALSWSGNKPAAVATNSIINGVLTFQIPANTAQWPTPLGHIDVWMQASSNTEPVSVLQGGEQDFLVFPNITQSQFAFATTNVTVSANSNSAPNTALTVTPPAGVKLDFFWKAWPGLLSQLQNSSASIQLQLTNTSNSTLTNLTDWKFDGTNIQFQLGNDPNVSRIISGLNITNKTSAICNGTILAPNCSVMVSSNITILRSDN